MRSVASLGVALSCVTHPAHSPQSPARGRAVASRSTPAAAAPPRLPSVLVSASSPRPHPPLLLPGAQGRVSPRALGERVCHGSAGRCPAKPAGSRNTAGRGLATARPQRAAAPRRPCPPRQRAGEQRLALAGGHGPGRAVCGAEG